MPRVSVLMPAYDAGRYVDEAVASLVEQSYPEWELVAIDDGSSDNTRAVLLSWAERDRRIRFYRNDQNLGIGMTRQRALSLAHGEYAAVLDADDIALPGWLSTRVAFLDRHPEIAAATGPRIIVDECSKRIRVTRETKMVEVLSWQMLFGNPICHPSTLFRISAAKMIGGYSKLPCIEDWDFSARLSKVGQIAQVDPPLMMYRVHPTSTSGSLGSSRGFLEPIVTEIISRNVQAATGLGVPPELAWYLYRNRPPFRGSETESGRALVFLLEAYREFVRCLGADAKTPAVAAAMLLDACNVLRCGGWSPRRAGWVIHSIMATSGRKTFISRQGLLQTLKLLSIPVAAAARKA
jgi:glycosyltransferase involved in cell wall biosynthesis